ncbi:hypothetical protein E2C01_040873 [Portunus trituberculatus]|uniref:Uncharacterized protein n=1 Tax=Portunus trituberculatus TaxID=210409 RepID=A0A5B7FQE3_PORTR|nr:hypothetical protein [Portunus trituberculatus]
MVMVVVVVLIEVVVGVVLIVVVVVLMVVVVVVLMVVVVVVVLCGVGISSAGNTNGESYLYEICHIISDTPHKISEAKQDYKK